MTYTAENWPIACAMLPFGNLDRQGGPIQDASAEEWAEQLREVKSLGFTEVDPTDTWVRVADLEAARLAELTDVISDVGLTIPAISTSRRSVLDAEHGAEYLAYSHRLLDVAAELGVTMVSFGFFQALTPEQQQTLWFWLVDGYQDPDDARVRARGASLVRELAEHAERNGQQITLEMYQDTYVGTCDSAVAFLDEVGHDACGLNPDLGNRHCCIERSRERLTANLAAQRHSTQLMVFLCTDFHGSSPAFETRRESAGRKICCAASRDGSMQQCRLAHLAPLW